MLSVDDYVATRGPGLLRLAVVLTGRVTDAEDLVQDCLAKAIDRWETLTAAGDPDAYMRQMIVNKFIDDRRRFTRLIAFRRQSVPAPIEDPAVQAVNRDEILTALRTLTARRRAVLVLRYYEDLDDQAIAELLGCSRSTVRSLAARALNDMKPLIEPSSQEREVRHAD